MDRIRENMVCGSVKGIIVIALLMMSEVILFVTILSVSAGSNYGLLCALVTAYGTCICLVGVALMCMGVAFGSLVGNGIPVSLLLLAMGFMVVSLAEFVTEVVMVAGCVVIIGVHLSHVMMLCMGLVWLMCGELGMGVLCCGCVVVL